MVSRVLLLIVTTLLFSLTLGRERFLITPWIFLALTVYLVVSLIRQRKEEREKIISYVESLLMDETFHISPVSRKGLYCDIHKALEDLVEKSLSIRSEYQEQGEILDALLNHINLGLLAYDGDGSLSLINKRARISLDCGYGENIGKIDLLTEDQKRSLLDFNSPVRALYQLKNDESIYMDSSDIILKGQKVRILSLQNIRKTLDEKEQDSWNTLIKTMNHEIANSITPISSLASSALAMLEGTEESDLYIALETIAKRSRRLLSFISEYKQLTGIPAPDKSLIDLAELFREVSPLLEVMAGKQDARLIVGAVPERLQLFCDRKLVEQVLINLVKNSLEAGAPKVELVAKMKEGTNLSILVIDEGCGFSRESREKAFIPFYTTRESGSGLGLSICRQIMQLHGGSISIESGETGSLVELLFP